MQVFESKEEYFIHNGAILLEKQISCNQGRDIETIGVFLPRKSDKLQITMILIYSLVLKLELSTKEN